MIHTETAKIDPPLLVSPKPNPIILRLAETPEEIISAQRLRYKTFYEEFNVPAPQHVANEGRDYDEYDPYADHLIVIDTSISNPSEQIVGTYRLFRREQMPAELPFFSAAEFNISPLIKNGGKLLELGRSCVLPDYRTKYVMQRLWQGIADYLSLHSIDLMFGCASFHEGDPEKISDQLAYLHYFHAPPENLCPIANPDCTEGLAFKPKEELDARLIFSDLPPLIKGYLRLGAYIGKGAFIDNKLQHIDVCIVLPTKNVTEKYKKHYELKV
jgi:L-ornithine Nalpha-acyltransferase